MAKNADPTFWRKCAGAIFRRCAPDLRWLNYQLEYRSDQVLALAPYIRSVRIGGVDLPGRLSWPQFVAGHAVATEINFLFERNPDGLTSRSGECPKKPRVETPVAPSQGRGAAEVRTGRRRSHDGKVLSGPRHDTADAAQLSLLANA
jgi:hypothetical protein